jgi:hypothetical protein
MTGMVHGFTNDSAELMRKKYNALAGFTELLIADKDNTNINAFTTEGWQPVGLVTQFSPSRAQEYAPLRSGGIDTLKGNLVVGDNLEYGISYTNPTLLGLRLGEASTYQYSVNYASDGQTTVSSSTSKTVTVVTSATGLTVGDMVEVDLTSGTSYGQFKEIAYIVAISSSTITHTRLSQQPAASATFKKIAGWGTGATPSNAGLLTNIGGVEAPAYRMKLVTYGLAPARNIVVHHFPEVEIINSVPMNLDNPKELISLGFTASVIAQYKTITDVNGVSLANAPYLGERYILPYES